MLSKRKPDKALKMNQEELNSVIEIIMKRGDPAYTTPSGAFLEYLRITAQNQNLAGYAKACKYYSTQFPESTHFIAAMTPAILCNNYFSVLPGFDYNKFTHWFIANAEWGDALKKAFSSPEALEYSVNSIRIAVSEYS